MGTLVLKRVDDALRDRDNILAVVRSIATNHSAKAISITHPHAGTQQKLFESVLDQANVMPEAVDYVEMHGTGTQAGDIAESASIASVFKKPRTNPLYVGTVKANVGHGEAASGVTSAIKAIMMFRKGIIPCHVGIKGRINPKLAFNGMDGIRIAFDNAPFPTKPDDRRRILINNFNATGGNTSLLLEEGPNTYRGRVDPRGSHVVAFSAANPISLTKNLALMEDHISLDSKSSISDIAYTTTARRIHHKYRIAFAVSSEEDLLQQLSTAVTSRSPFGGAPPVAFLFTGQSGCLRAAAADLLRASASFRHRLLSIDGICQSFGLPSVVDFLAGHSNEHVDDQVSLNQIALVAVEIALAEQWRAWGIEPAVVIGHSLGEYAALCFAGVLSIADALHLVGVRLRLLKSTLTPGNCGMMLVKTSVEHVEMIIKMNGLVKCEIAAINTPSATVVGGPRNDLERLKECLSESQVGVKAVFLQIPYAFHSSQMDAIMEPFKKAARAVRFNKPRIPVISTLLGATITDEGVFSGEYLAQQVREPVRFIDALHECQDYLKGRHPLWLEIGPTPVCIPMVRSTMQAPSSCLLASLDSREDNWKTITASLAKVYQAGLEVNWKAYHAEYHDSLNLVQLPTYAFDLKSHWLQYEGDWSITKNQQPRADSSTRDSTLQSTTVHRCDSHEQIDGVETFTFTTDFADPTLQTIARGHIVSGATLTPSSIYADIVMTVATYCWNMLRPNEECPAIDIASMEALKPLIVRSDGVSQPVKTVAQVAEDFSCVKVAIESVGVAEATRHVQCEARFGQADDWSTAWQQTAYLYSDRIERLFANAAQGKAHRMQRGMVYKLFSNLVEYDEGFQMIEEVVLDSEMMEATSSVRLRSAKGDFTCDPRWIDGLAHLSGFILNGSDRTPKDNVYISHGWQSMRFARRLEAETTYRTHIRMQPTRQRGVFAGDLHIFKRDEVVGVVAGIKFQEIKKAILPTLLHMKPHSAAQASPEPSNPTVRKISNGSDLLSTGNPNSEAIMTPASLKSRADDMGEIFRSVLAQELGMNPGEMHDKAEFIDLGVDSLLSLAIISAFTAHTSIQLPFTFFHDNPTLASALAYFENNDNDNENENGTDTKIIPAIAFQKHTGNKEKEAHPTPPTTHLQRTTNPTAPTLILFPDGSGSAASYIHLRPLPTEANIIALSSPFVTRPEDYTITLEAITETYVKAIQALQLTGPVVLGGWSIGAAYAYEAARQLMALGRSVDGLIVIDAVAPGRMAGLPVETVGVLETAGILGTAGVYDNDGYGEEEGLEAGEEGAGVESWLLKRRRKLGRGDVVQRHFKASIRALDAYVPEPLPGVRVGRGPVPCRAVWARCGVFECLGEERMGVVRAAHGEAMGRFNEMQEWLLVGRRVGEDGGVGDGGWGRLVGGRVEGAVVDGHHFDVVRPPRVCVRSSFLFLFSWGPKSVIRYADLLAMIRCEVSVKRSRKR